DLSPSITVANFTLEDTNKVLRVLAALKNAPPEAQDIVQNLVDGKRPEIQTLDNETQMRKNSRPPANNLSMSSGVMKMDAKSDKWDRNSLSWKPYYYFRKAMCKAYQTLLVTEEAVCL
ncbi:hypothetical protein GcC1_062029, partial [Golovinomyces cichoracearum]